MPSFSCCETEKNSHCCELGNRRKCILKINSSFLCIPFGYKTCFVPIKSTICLVFHPIYPFTTYQLFVSWFCYQSPCTLSFQSINFFLHCLLPMRIFNCLMKELGFIYLSNI